LLLGVVIISRLQRAIIFIICSGCVSAAAAAGYMQRTSVIKNYCLSGGKILGMLRPFLFSAFHPCVCFYENGGERRCKCVQNISQNFFLVSYLLLCQMRDNWSSVVFVPTAILNSLECFITEKL